MIPRSAHLKAVQRLLRDSPVVALIGARQVGKTTLAKQVARRRRRTHFFDLESAADRARLADPLLALSTLTGLVVLDEVQRRPELFPTLRVLADRHPLRACFLVFGSAAPALLRQSSESLAGRIAYYELPCLSHAETGPARRTGFGCGEAFHVPSRLGATCKAIVGAKISWRLSWNATCPDWASRFPAIRWNFSGQ